MSNITLTEHSIPEAVKLISGSMLPELRNFLEGKANSEYRISLTNNYIVHTEVDGVNTFNSPDLVNAVELYGKLIKCTMEKYSQAMTGMLMHMSLKMPYMSYSKELLSQNGTSYGTRIEYMLYNISTSGCNDPESHYKYMFVEGYDSDIYNAMTSAVRFSSEIKDLASSFNMLVSSLKKSEFISDLDIISRTPINVDISIGEFTEGTEYEKGQIVYIEDTMYIAKESVNSGCSFNPENFTELCQNDSDIDYGEYSDWHP